MSYSLATTVVAAVVIFAIGAECETHLSCEHARAAGETKSGVQTIDPDGGKVVIMTHIFLLFFISYYRWYSALYQHLS